MINTTTPQVVSHSMSVLDGVQTLFERTSERSEVREEGLMHLFLKMQQQFDAMQKDHAKEKGILEGRIANLSRQLESNKSGMGRLSDALTQATSKQERKEVVELNKRFEELDEKIAIMQVATIHATSSAKESSEALLDSEKKVQELRKRLEEVKISADATRKIVSTAATAAGTSIETTESEQLAYVRRPQETRGIQTGPTNGLERLREAVGRLGRMDALFMFDIHLMEREHDRDFAELGKRVAVLAQDVKDLKIQRE